MQAQANYTNGAGPTSGGPSSGASTSQTSQPNNFTSASLYVGDLKPEVTEALLFEIFNAVGPVASIRVCRNAITRKSLGYAYVNFHNVIDAERALDTMNFTSIRGRPCRIMWTMRDPTLRKSGKHNIFVKNLDVTIDHKTLYDTFSMFGDILSCKVAMKETGDGGQTSLQYGFVHYSTDDAARKAIEKVNGMEIAGKTVVVEEFKPKEQRNDGPRKFTNVFIRNLPPGMTTDQLKTAVKKVMGAEGEELDLWTTTTISSSFVNPTATVVKLADGGENKACWGCVDFKSPEKAEEAVEKINAAEVKLTPGSPSMQACAHVSRSQRQKQLGAATMGKFQPRRDNPATKFAGVNVYIKNLHDTIDDERLREEFKTFGDVTSARVMRDEQSRSKGFGFVCFKMPDQATKAITEMNTKIVEGKPLYVALHQPRAVRDAQLAQRFSQQRGTQGQGNPMMGGGGFQNQQRGGMFYGPGGGRGAMNPMMGAGQYNMNPAYNPQMQGGPNMLGGPMTPQGFGQQGFGQRPGMYRNPRQPQQRGYQQNRQARGGPRGNRQDYQTPGGPAIQQPMPNALQKLPAQPQQLTSTMLSNADPQQQKQMIGERVFPLIQQREPKLSGKITGMLLEMDNTELLHLLESPQALNDKINEALAVLREHGDTGGVSAE